MALREEGWHVRGGHHPGMAWPRRGCRPGHKIGGLEAVYVDTRTGLPSFGTVKVGMPTRHRLVLVPVDRAAVGPGYLKVCYDRKQVKDAPSSGTDGELPAACEEAIFSTTA